MKNIHREIEVVFARKLRYSLSSLVKDGLFAQNGRSPMIVRINRVQDVIYRNVWIVLKRDKV